MTNAFPHLMKEFPRNSMIHEIDPHLRKKNAENAPGVQEWPPHVVANKQRSCASKM